jgi:hypothetical protein
MPMSRDTALWTTGGSDMIDHGSRRKYERIRVGGCVRLMVDGTDGLRMTSGHLVDLSEGGCAICTTWPIGEQVAGRVQVEFGGQQLWLPVVTRWVRCDAHGWIAGCSFDRPTDEKQRAIRALLWARRNRVRS